MNRGVQCIRPRLASGCLVAALIAGAIGTAGCKKDESKLDKIIASAQAPASAPPAPTTPFAFPSASGLPPSQIMPTVYRAERDSPPGQEDRIDQWLRGVSVPAEMIGPTKRFASDLSPLTFRYEAKTVQCAIRGRLAPSAKFFVTASLSCLDDTGKTVKKTDWDSPAKAKRGELVDLPVDAAFVTQCLEGGGVKLGVELLGSPCAIPFPHQVRCAGEYNTCRETCAQSPECNERCETNRLHCLDVCTK